MAGHCGLHSLLVLTGNVIYVVSAKLEIKGLLVRDLLEELYCVIYPLLSTG